MEPNLRLDIQEDPLERFENRALKLGLRPLGVMVVLGIARLPHALLQV